MLLITGQIEFSFFWHRLAWLGSAGFGEGLVGRVRVQPDGSLAKPWLTVVHERRNGQFVVQMGGHPDFGVPFRQ
jgi:hypothetical protein